MTSSPLNMLPHIRRRTVSRWNMIMLVEICNGYICTRLLGVQRRSIMTINSARAIRPFPLCRQRWPMRIFTRWRNFDPTDAFPVLSGGAISSDGCRAMIVSRLSLGIGMVQWLLERANPRSAGYSGGRKRTKRWFKPSSTPARAHPRPQKIPNRVKPVQLVCWFSMLEVTQQLLPIERKEVASSIHLTTPTAMCSLWIYRTSTPSAKVPRCYVPPLPMWHKEKRKRHWSKHCLHSILPCLWSLLVGYHNWNRHGGYTISRHWSVWLRLWLPPSINKHDRSWCTVPTVGIEHRKSPPWLNWCSIHTIELSKGFKS